MLIKSSFRKCTVALDDVGWQRNNSGAASVDQVWQGKAWSCKFDSNSQGNFDKGKACNYCHEAYATFIRDGFVSLGGSDVKVPIKILRDTARAMTHTLWTRGCLFQWKLTLTHLHSWDWFEYFADSLT